MKRREPTAPKDTIGGREIRQVPGAFGDAFRALESLPGVTPIVSGLPYYFVRGAPPGNTGFFIDGVRVPGLFHLGVGPAVMYPALIDHVDLFKGAYPVSFGRFAGGVLSAETVRPADHARADWTLRLFDAGALVEAPFGKQADGSPPRGSALVSGRYGYPGLLLLHLRAERRARVLGLPDPCILTNASRPRRRLRPRFRELRLGQPARRDRQDPG